MRVLKENALGLVVDVQEKFMPHLHKANQTIANIEKLIDGLNALEIPILVTQQYTKGLGESVPEIKNKVQPFNPFEKLTFSCCGNAEFTHKIGAFNKRNVIIAGIESHVCVLQTAIDLVEKGFLPVVVADCITSRKKSDKKFAITRLANEGVIITTYESILLELCKQAGDEQFKAVSKIIK